MLVSITERCRMGCSHCMDDAKPTGNDMTFDTFKKTILFYKKVNDLSLVITGGEPMEHPMFWDMLKYAKSKLKGSIITVTTNGMVLEENDELFNKVKEFDDIIFQVTSVKEYYPKEVDTSKPVFHLPNVYVCTKLEQIYPKGRAVTNNIKPYNVKISKCFNIRSATRTTGDVKKAIRQLRLRGKFCTPSITWDGKIHVGESVLCPDIGKTVTDTVEDITQAIIDYRCDNCGLISKWPKMYQNAVGEVNE